MSGKMRILLAVIALASAAVAVSYPIRYGMEARSSEANQQMLQAMRDEDRAEPTAEQPEQQQKGADAAEAAPPRTPSEETGADHAGTPAEPDKTAVKAPEKPEAPETPAAKAPTEAEAPGTPAAAPEGKASTEEPPQRTGLPTRAAGGDAAASGVLEGTTGARPARDAESTPASAAAPDSKATPSPNATLSPRATPARRSTPSPAPTPSPTPTASPTPTIVPTPTANRYERKGALPYPSLEKVELDEGAILPELRRIYELNPDLVGWLTIPDTEIDYPVVQTQDSEYYLTHDFFGEENRNGQIILDTRCDPYTPSYNLVISGHNMRSGQMFGDLADYASKKYWEKHKKVEFDTLMDRRAYVVLAAFYSADYDVDEEGFRYNADIQYANEAEQWLEEIRENRQYDTEIEAEFGDQFLTLTTCNKSRRKDGRFVVICRRIREGEEIE